MIKKQKKEINFNGIQIIHTVPRMDDTEREKSKKAISNELYEIFLKIQAHLKLENENLKT